MWRCHVLLISVLPLVWIGVCLSDDVTGGEELSSESRDWAKLSLNAETIVSLVERLETVREKLKRVPGADRDASVAKIRAQVNRLEERHCKENQFECGHRGGECVYELFVCDGHRDCSDGYDEDADVCSIAPALAGITYRGIVHWENCETRDDHPINITILGYRIRKYSSSLIWIKALVESTYRKNGRLVTGSHTAIGHYKFSRRQIVLLGEGQGSSNAVYCDFDEGEHRTATCELVRVASLEHCATIHLTLDE